MQTHKEYEVTAQRGADNFDSRGTTVVTGPNFPNLIAECEADGYPRIVAARQRLISDWEAVEDYPYDEATP